MRHLAAYRTAQVLKARALAALVATGLALAPPAGQADTGVQMALSLQPVTLPAAGAVRGQLPADGDIDRYRRIFQAQHAGDFASAARLVGELSDRSLIGHVTAQRLLHPTAGQASYEELAAWLAAHADHPDAERIYALAQRRGSASGLAEPRTSRVPVFSTVERFGVPRCVYADLDDGVERQVRRYVRRDGMGRALSWLEGRRGAVDTVTYARGLGEVAAGYLFYGDDARARDLGRQAAALGGGSAPRGAWSAGLALWRLGDYAAAAGSFAEVATADCASAWWQAGGAYWAHRAHLRAGDPAASVRALEQAAAYPRTFYGLLATRALGRDPSFDFAAPPLTAQHLDAIARDPAGRRGLALLLVGERTRAEGELVQVALRGTPATRPALIALAEQASLPQLALTVGRTAQPGAGRYYDGALYPLSAVSPRGGSPVDRAVYHAITREESRFDSRAVSHAGAVGLMQLMPATASAVSGINYRGGNRAALFDPTLNFELGQRYLRELFSTGVIGGDLIRAFAAYNAGPGNVSNWMTGIDHRNDPLLFVEVIPILETRFYLERTLAALWIYRTRLSQPTPSLDDLVAGSWPAYRPMDSGRVAER